MNKLTIYAILACICSWTFVSSSCLALEGTSGQKTALEWVNKTKELPIATCVNDTLAAILKDFVATEKTCSDLRYSADSLLFVLKIFKEKDKYILILKSNEFRTEILEDEPLAITMINDTPCFIYQNMPPFLFINSERKYIFHYKEYEQGKKDELPVVISEDSPYSTVRYTIYSDGLFHLNAEDRPCFGIYEEYDLLKPEIE